MPIFSSHHLLVALLYSLLHLRISFQVMLSIVVRLLCLLDTLARRLSLFREFPLLDRFSLSNHFDRPQIVYGRIYVSVTLRVFLEFEHHLFGYIVWHKTLGSAFCRKLSQVPILRVLMDVVFFENVNKLLLLPYLSAYFYRE